MIQTLLSCITWFIGLILMQVLVFNHVHFFGATPMPYVFFLLILPTNTPRWVFVLTGFLMGLCIDLFTNTPGIAASGMCFVGLLTPWLLRLFSPKDQEDETFSPSRKTMKWSGFLRYAFCAVAIHCMIFFTLESFSFFDIEMLLFNIAGSTLLTLLFIVAIEATRSK